MKQELQSIINGETTGSHAVAILRSALEEYGSATSRAIELGQMIGNAEDVLIYGKEGRPLHRTFR